MLSGGQGSPARFGWSRGEREIFHSQILKVGVPSSPSLPSLWHCHLPAGTSLQGLPYTYDPGLSSKSRLIHPASGGHLHLGSTQGHRFAYEPPDLSTFFSTSFFSGLLHFCLWYQDHPPRPIKESHLRPGRKWVPRPSPAAAHSAPFDALLRPQARSLEFFHLLVPVLSVLPTTLCQPDVLSPSPGDHSSPLKRISVRYILPFLGNFPCFLPAMAHGLDSPHPPGLSALGWASQGDTGVSGALSSGRVSRE